MGRLVLLSALVAGTSLVVTHGVRFKSVAERAAAALLTAHVLVAIALYVLGFTNRLEPTRLVVVTTTTCVSAAAITLAQVRLVPHLAETAAGALAIVAAPIRVVRGALRERSVLAIPIALAGAFLAWSTLTAYYAPSWRSWDALWYHETIVGETIQAHGLAKVTLPETLQNVNGYPRFGELCSVFCALLYDRRLVELPSIGAAILLGCAVHAGARDRGASSTVAGALAAGVVLTPASVVLVRSTFIDVHVAAFLACGAHFAARRRLEPGHAVLAAAAAALAIVTKYLALPMALAIAFVAAFRMVHRSERGSPLALAGGASLVLCAIAAVYVRNLVLFHNPFWPNLTLDFPRFGIHWEGLPDQRGIDPLDMDLPRQALLDAITSAPYSIPASHKEAQIADYGFGALWIVFPAAFVAVVSAAWNFGRTVIRGALHRPHDRREITEALPVLIVAFFAAAAFKMIPALWAARYHLGTIALAAMVLPYLSRRRGDATRLFAAVFAFSSIVTVIWSGRTILFPSELRALRAIPYPAREVANVEAIEAELPKDAEPPPPLDGAYGRWAPPRGFPSTEAAPLSPGFGEFRATLLGAGTVVVVDDKDYGAHPGLFWNDHYSNRVEFVSGWNLAERGAELGAEWAICVSYEACGQNLARHGWVTWGAIGPGFVAQLYRRPE